MIMLMLISIGLAMDSVLSGIIQITFVAYLVIQSVKRMHDVDRSGWFLLIPLYNLVLALTPGTVGNNRFGFDPKNQALG
jgi:uncharacterized membrane protein YhaH (DUF805 family)